MGGRQGCRARSREDGRRRKKLVAALLWQLDWGAAAEKIRAAAEASGGPLPPLPFLEAKPELDEHLDFAWQAFVALSSDRQLGMSVGPIPWSSIDRYALRFGIDGGDEFEVLASLITAMDAAYLEHGATKAEAAKPK